VLPLVSAKYYDVFLKVLVMFSLTSTFTFGTEYPKILIENSKQMLLVVTAEESAQTGALYLFHRDMESKNWQISADKIPVVVGRNGLAWSSEKNSGAMPKIPKKVEGDNKSPAGVFTLGVCFGFAEETEMKDLSIPYLHITELTECIDDRNSLYYNKIIQSDRVNDIDWNSSEKMRQIDPQYKIGVMVNYNTESPKSGSGSCIFLHIWGAPSKPTSGCTAMSEAHMREIVFWLDKEKNPILVQLTKPLYDSLKDSWFLPEI
jgi:L,D-peptidoglycan transpeptidase YkuD (ErfK/YbiS/YcfS/YnhG family)